MGSDSRKGRRAEAVGADSIETVIREQIREAIEALEEELEAVVGTARSARVGGSSGLPNSAGPIMNTGLRLEMDEPRGQQTRPRSCCSRRGIGIGFR